MPATKKLSEHVKKSFSLCSYKKAQAMPQDPMAATGDMGMGESDPMAMPEESTSNTQAYSLSSLSAAMEQDPFTTMNTLSSAISPDVQLQWDSADGQPTGGRAEEVIKPDTWNSMTDEKERASFIGAILDALPNEMRGDTMSEEDSVTGTQQTARIPASIEAAVTNSNNAIRKLAEQYLKATPKAAGYNHLKTAQSRVGMDTIVFGPDTAQLFPSVNQVGNAFHVMERNKGWGLKPHEFSGIDYEMVWRKHIMDKFYREYRDKDGNWVGGYLNKRFETDRSVSDLNNYQLKPGQLRKPVLPEYGNIGSRMEAKHEQDGKGKTFNWNKANSSAPMVKLASGVTSEIESMLERVSILESEPKTPFNQAVINEAFVKIAEKIVPSIGTIVVSSDKLEEVKTAVIEVLSQVSPRLVGNTRLIASLTGYLMGNGQVKVGTQIAKKQTTASGTGRKITFNINSKKKVTTAYSGLKPLKPLEGLKAPGQKSTDLAKSVWNCAGCGALHGSHESRCAQCGLSKGSQPSSFAIQPQGIKPGEKPTWNNSNNGPTHITKNAPLPRVASVLSVHKKDDEDDMEEDDPEDFKQLRSEPVDDVSQLIQHHTKVNSDFDALGGAPTKGLIQPFHR